MFRSRIAFRGLPLFLLLVVVSPLAGQQATSNKVYVANQGSNEVTVIDAARLEVVATVSVGDRPHNVNLDRPASVSIVRVDDDRVVATMEDVGERIEHVVSPTTNRAYVTEDLGQNAVVAIDLEERVVIDAVPVGVKPHGLWPTPDGRYLLVPNQLTGTVSRIDTKTMEVDAEVEVGRTPTMVAVSPDGRRAYVTLFGERGLAVFDPTSVQSDRMQVNDVVRVGERPAQVAVTPDGRFVLVPCEGPGALYVISADTHEVVAVVPTGGKAHGVDVSSDGRHAFVSNWADDSVSVVDLERRVVVREVPVGDEPAGVDVVSPPGVRVDR